MQTTKENSKTPETTETKGTQVAPKRNPADINAGNDQNKGNTNNDPTKQKPRPATGKQEDVELEEDEEVEDENTSYSELDSDVDQAGSEKNSPDPSRNRTGMNDPKKQGL